MNKFGFFFLNFCFCNFVDMKASFIIFVLIQIAAECRSAYVPGMANKSDVIWVTDELPSEKITNSEPVGNLTGLEDILQTLEEIREMVRSQFSSYDPNIQGDSPYDGNFNQTQYDESRIRRDKIKNFQANEFLIAVLNYTGHRYPNGTIMSTSIDFERRNNISEESIDKIFNKAASFEKDVIYPTLTQTIPALCNHTSTMKENVINLQFNMRDTKSSSTSKVINVTSAWLRIYKFAPEKLKTTKIEPINFTLMYSNKTSLKKNYKKTVKLNPQYLQMDEERWIEWDVREVVSIWLNEMNDTSKNFGKIRIKVADNEDHALPAHEFFNMKNCSKITELPVMLPFDDRNSEYVMFPHLNVTFQVIPRSDALCMKLIEGVVAFKNRLQDQEKSKCLHANENQNTFNQSDSSK